MDMKQLKTIKVCSLFILSSDDVDNEFIVKRKLTSVYSIGEIIKCN